MKVTFLSTLAGLAFCSLFALTIVAQDFESPINQRSLTPANVVDMALIDDVEEGFVKLFDGKTLDGWEQKNGTAKYEVADGTILGTTVEGSPNSFLCSKKEYADFELRFEVKVDDELNSGVQIRSVSDPEVQKGRVQGPQVEIEAGPAEAGYIYSEGTGRKWISPEQPQHDHFKNGEWNKYRVIADGARIQTWINGNHIEDLETAEVEALKGFLGLQVHSIRKNQKGPFKVQWRNIRIKELDGTERRVAHAHHGTPTIDGKIDDIWKTVPRMRTSRSVEEHEDLGAGEKPAVAWVRTMWDDGHLYCLAEVTDPKVGGENAEPWESDSVEFFVDGNLSQATSYDGDDGQYRTTADGSISVGSSNDEADYQSKVTKTKTGYIVESCIKMDTKADQRIGFDAQVNNDAGEGRRQSTMKWNDWTNETYQDLSGIGVLKLIGKK